MRSSAWFVASCALILCALGLIDGAKGQQQCSEVRDATADRSELVLGFLEQSEGGEENNVNGLIVAAVVADSEWWWW